MDTKTAALVAEVERLNECLRYEQHRAGRRGTHGTDCYKWGPEHYECAMRQLERLQSEDSAELDLAHKTIALQGNEIERLTTELAEAKQDAERYRQQNDILRYAIEPFAEHDDSYPPGTMPSNWAAKAICAADKIAMRRTDAGDTTG